MSSSGKQVKRRLIFISILVFLLVLPAAVMGYIAYSSLEEIKFKADFYYERVAYDISLRMMHTLEAPLYEPGLLLLREHIAGENLTEYESIVPILENIEANTPYADRLIFVTGPIFGNAKSRLYGKEATMQRLAEESRAERIRQAAEGIFDETAMFGSLPRGFYPFDVGSEILGINAGTFEDFPFVRVLMLNRDRKPIGLLYYILVEDAYLENSRTLYETTNFTYYSAPGRKDIANEIGFELFFNEEPFNDEAIAAARGDIPGRVYVYKSDIQDSLYWSVRAFLKTPERTRVSSDVVNSMLAMMLATFALVILGVLLLYSQVWREIELARMKSQFVSNVSHELKTPLSLIRLFSETLLMGRSVQEEEKQRFYAIINSESLRLTNMIDNILDFARIEEGKKVYDIAPQNAKELLLETLESYKYQFDAAGFNLQTAFSKDLPLILADPNGFKQAVLNLLDNAIKYSGESKWLGIRLTRDGRYVKVEVEDRGLGISAEELPRVFEMFYRSDSANSMSVRGSGLGLAMIKHIMDSHRGKVEAESVLGRGSTFAVYFPAVPGAGLSE